MDSALTGLTTKEDEAAADELVRVELVLPLFEDEADLELVDSASATIQAQARETPIGLAMPLNGEVACGLAIQFLQKTFGCCSFALIMATLKALHVAGAVAVADCLVVAAVDFASMQSQA